jgi:adenylate cyclase
VSKDPAVLEFGSFRLDPVERSLTSVGGEPIQLTRRLYDTLLFMVERPGRLLEKHALLDAVWKGSIVEENTLSRTISALRQLLGERPGEHRYIETVSGLGYRFVQPVRGSQATAQSRPNEHSIAVLPFEDLSRERDQGHFADGLAEEVLNRLAGVQGLRLIAKSSSFQFRERVASARVIGQALSVDYLLTGAVRKEGAHLRITAQLIEAANDSQVWSERFDRELDDVFAIQDDIARAVAQVLRKTLSADDPSFTEAATHDLEAYDLYLRGVAIGAQAGAHGMIRSAELLREAVTRDPSFAAAWLALAEWSRGRLIFAPEHAARAIEDIEEAVARLLELAPQWWASHLARSWRLLLRRDWLEMRGALERARELAPGMPTELSFSLGAFCAQVRDLQASLDHLRAAARNNPLSLLISGVVQVQLTCLGRDAEAEAEYLRSLDLAGDREMVEHLVLHRLWARGRPFREQFCRYLDLTQTKPAPVLEEVYSVCEEPDLALEKLRAAAAAPDYQNPPRQLVLGWWMAAYGDVNASFDALWRGYVDLRFVNVSWLWLPVFARVREHPRFPELFERVGLTEYWRETSRTPALERTAP